MTTTEQKQISVSQTDSEAAIDLKILGQLRRELAEVSPGLLTEFVALYLKNSPEMIAKMKTALAHRDGELLNRMAHTLKANSARLGATDFSHLCQELETLAENEQFSGIGPKISRLEACYSQVETILRREVPPSV